MPSKPTICRLKWIVSSVPSCLLALEADPIERDPNGMVAKGSICPIAVMPGASPLGLSWAICGVA